MQLSQLNYVASGLLEQPRIASKLAVLFFSGQMVAAGK